MDLLFRAVRLSDTDNGACVPHRTGSAVRQEAGIAEGRSPSRTVNWGKRLLGACSGTRPPNSAYRSLICRLDLSRDGGPKRRREHHSGVAQNNQRFFAFDVAKLLEEITTWIVMEVGDHPVGASLC